jgi:signal transduction histidine kinase
VALEKARLVRSLMLNNEQLSSTKDRLERSLHDLELLYQLETAMSRASTLDEIARSVITMSARACRAAAGALLVEASRGQHQLFVCSLERPTDVHKVMVRPGEGIAARAMQRRELITADGPSQIDDPARVRRLLDLELRGAVAVPLCGEAPRACGALALYNLERGPVHFGAGDGSLLRLVTASVSTQLRLFRAREDRERQDRLTTIGGLLSGVMHDLKTPLTLISGYLELMIDTDDRPTRRTYGVTINEQFAVIATMQREILAYARGERSVLVRKVYLRQFFDELRRQIEHEIASSRVKLVLDVEEHGAAFFDGGKITRAVLNLAHNAIEAMDSKSGTLYLGCHNDEADVVITVADTGPGIPEEIRDRLFQPFVTAGKPLGTGLGLSIVRSIVDEHGGVVDVQSSGRGTRFTLRLPQNVPPASRRLGSTSE